MLLNFDYDGVIVDSLGNILDLTVKTQELMGIGRKPTKEDFATLQEMTYDELARVIEIPDNMVTKFIETVHGLEKEHQGISHLFPGISDTLKSLAENHDIVIITATNTAMVVETLERNGLTMGIKKVLGGDLGLSKARRIAMAKSIFNPAHDDSAMIGDAISDIRQGKIARVKTVAVTWGFQSRELLRAESPDHIIDTPEELLAVFKG